MVKLNNISLVAVASTHHRATIEALKYSSKEITFGEVLFFSETNPCPTDNFFRYIKTRKFNNISEWGEFIVFELHKYISTPFIILIHADGFIVNPHKWSNDFLKYDYIGAPWPLPKDKVSFRDANGEICRVGNGVSLRSKKILELPSKLNLEWKSFILNIPHEDGFLCAQHKVMLQQNGIKFAPLETAIFFSREYRIKENIGVEPFIFHKWKGENSKFPNFTDQKFHNKIFNLIKKIIMKF